MSGVRELKVVRFASAQHWNCGLGARTRVLPDGGITPIQPLAPTARCIKGAAFAPAFGRDGTLYWRTDDGHLVWLAPDAQAPCRMRVAVLAASSRLVPGRRWLWSVDAQREQLIRLDLATFGPDHIALPLPPGPVIDIAGDGKDGVWILGGQSRDSLWHLTSAGLIEPVHAMPAPALSLRASPSSDSESGTTSPSASTAPRTLSPDAA